MAPAPRQQIRPSDRARDDAATALREHFAAGRLDSEELERRVELAYAARTRADLRSLFRDLPWDPRSRARRAHFWRVQRNALRAHAVTYAGVNGLLVGIWALTGQGEFWPAESLAGWGAAFGAHWMVVRTLRRSGMLTLPTLARSPSAAPRRSLRRS